jgi:hypothetical protein
MVFGGGGTTLGAEGEEALANKGCVKTRRHDNCTRGKKGLHLLGALDLPTTLEVGRSLLLLLLLLWLLLLVVPLGEITPRWWWWRRDRWWWWWWRRAQWWWWWSTTTPLRALGLGASLLGPASSPLALLDGSETRGVRDKRPIGATQPASPLFLRPPGATRGGGATCSPFTFVQRARGHGGSSGARTGGLGTPNWYTRDLDPTKGVPTTGLSNFHAALVESRQRGQDRRSQPRIITQRRDALGEDQRFGDKGITSNPLHQEFQLLLGQIGPRPVLDRADVIWASKPAAQTRSPLLRHDPELQEIADHMHRGQATGCQGLDPVQHGQEL